MHLQLKVVVVLPPNGDVICVTKDNHVYYCEKTSPNKDVWKCDLQVARTDIPPALSDALDLATQDTQNNTKVPNTDLLTDESLFENENTTDGNDNSKSPKDLDDESLIINPELP